MGALDCTASVFAVVLAEEDVCRKSFPGSSLRTLLCGLLGSTLWHVWATAIPCTFSCASPGSMIWLLCCWSESAYISLTCCPEKISPDSIRSPPTLYPTTSLCVCVFMMGVQLSHYCFNFHVLTEVSMFAMFIVWLDTLFWGFMKIFCCMLVIFDECAVVFWMDMS